MSAARSAKVAVRQSPVDFPLPRLSVCSTAIPRRTSASVHAVVHALLRSLAPEPCTTTTAGTGAVVPDASRDASRDAALGMWSVAASVTSPLRYVTSSVAARAASCEEVPAGGPTWTARRAARIEPAARVVVGRIERVWEDGRSGSRESLRRRSVR